ncbi:NAD(P)H dehydrogenase, subunit NdhF3 family [Thalassoporum mexicanum PCC 7367]|uniref:NAD(P)H-quinone oxidoreductase subunit F n=1 Tax=Thalassoporum mexicanum TaxID=3457544 RepID=UPI00029FA32D|nr:NAD(P)H-quinone oxidoreductase subunit F [Pseudanabaena sp. PCC 7367]AFY69877.1 NAD(P)H dehydrogenase, subunit NdhF3 family [Pseudanabaena sp. PCC 7367]
MNQFLLQTSWCVPFYCLLGAIATVPWSAGIVHRTGQRPAAYLNILMTLLALLHSIVSMAAIWGQPVQRLDFSWFQVADFSLDFTMELSEVSIGATVLVTGLSLLAQVFALGYMEKDWSLGRFYALMGFFEGAMIGLALSDSLLLSYALLEMLTLSTYLLVGFWYAQPLVVTAARDAFLTKRVGDLLLLMSVVALSCLAGSLSFSDLETWALSDAPNQLLNPFTTSLLCLGLTAGPIGKCAQFPLHLWLDEAMEGPNPASILRNSLVVGSGAYVLIKLQQVLALSPIALDFLIVIGVITAVGSSFVAIAQIDIKRALCHSTSAFLGLVFIGVGLQWTEFALLMFFVHAIAKALLFMSIGSVINTTSGQNMTEMGGLWSRMPATTTAFVVGSAGLTALFPLGAYWVMWLGTQAFWYNEPIIFLVLIAVNTLTMMNLTRVFRLVFWGEPRQKTRRAPEVIWPMSLAMVSLSIVTLLVPLIMLNLGMFPQIMEINLWPLAVMLGSSCLGAIVGSKIYLHRNLSRPMNLYQRMLQDFFAYDLYIDRLYRVTIVGLVSLVSRLSAWFDRIIVDGVVNLAGITTIFGAEGLKYNVSGQLQLYVLVIFLSLSLLVLLLANWSSFNAVVNILPMLKGLIQV